MRSRSLLLAGLLLVVTSCGAPAPVPAAPMPAGPGSPSASTAVGATDVDGPYVLAFSLPRAAWAADEPIVGEARLALAGLAETRLFGSGSSLLGFGFREVGGTRQMGPAWTGDCAIHRLALGRPMVSPITKSGGWSDDQPDGAFYRDFFTRPGVRLPRGDWDISALAIFNDGEGCAGTSHELQATVRVHIGD